MKKLPPLDGLSHTEKDALPDSRVVARAVTPTGRSRTSEAKTGEENVP
jgi:hypothetical protein